MRTEEPNLRCCRDGFSQDLQTFAADVELTASTLAPVMFPPGRAMLATMPKGTGSAITATIGSRIGSLAFELGARSGRGCDDRYLDFVRTTSCERLGVAVLPPLRRVTTRTDRSCPSTYPSRRSYFEERWVVRIAAAFTEMSSNRYRGVKRVAVPIRSCPKLLRRAQRPGVLPAPAERRDLDSRRLD